MKGLIKVKGRPVLFLLLFLLVGSYVSMPAAVGETRVEVVARQFEFLPGRISAVVGEPLTLIFRSEDVTHGVYIDGMDVNLVIEPGSDVVVTIVPTMTGKFKIRCSVTCGPLHPFMVGELVVEEQGVNPLFVGSLASLLVVGLAATAYAIRRYPSGSRGGEE
ncbi:MAG: cupredoxin domain-containing protein [Thermoplasmata archaeon]